MEASQEKVGAVHELTTPIASKSRFWDLLLPVLTFVGTGIGVIGFVIFFGGFILWTRFDASGVPANEAVAQVPRGDLIVTGASFLVPAVLAALAAVAVAFVLWDAVVGNRRRHREQVAEIAAVKASDAAGKLQARADRLVTEAAASQTELDQLRQASINAPPGAERDSARTRLDLVEKDHARKADELARLQETEIPEANEAKTRAKFATANAQDNAPKLDRALQILIGGIPMLATQLLIISGGWSELNWGPRLLLLATAAASVAVAVVVVTITRSFAWFAAAVFLGVGVVIAMSTYERTHVETKESPFAAIQKGAPISGFYVAETSDAVYVAQPERYPTRRLALDHQDVTLIRLPKASLIDFTLGPLMNETRAYQRSLHLTLALCEQAAPRTVKTVRSSKPAHRARPTQRVATACASRVIKTLKVEIRHL